MGGEKFGVPFLVRRVEGKNLWKYIEEEADNDFKAVSVSAISKILELQPAKR